MDASAEKAERIRAISYSDIDRPENWPKADSRYCCIFDAINRVGQAKFGDLWTDQELCAMYWQESPQAVDDRQRALRAQTRRIPKAPPPPSNPRSIAPMALENKVRTKTAPHDAHVAAQATHHALELESAAVTAEQRLWEANGEALRRLIEAVDWIAQKCRDNELPSYARPASGGALWPVQAHEWNIDNPLAIFVSAGGPNRRFIQLDQSRLSESFIFFGRADLDRVTAILAHGSSLVAEVDLSKLSPYLQFAVRLALTKQYTSKSGAVTKDARIADFDDAWNEMMPNVPKTRPQLAMLASVTGWPNPQAIQSGLLGGNKRKKPG